MSYLKPNVVIEAATVAGTAKTTTGGWATFFKAITGGAILACATTMALTATAQTGLGIVGALLFPAGFVIIVLLGLELVTGGMALVPLAVARRRATLGAALRYFVVAIAGHLVGCLGYGALFAMTSTQMGTNYDSPVVHAIIAAAEGKTLGYEALGASGLALVFIKAILCNWMVSLGVIMAMTSTETLAKIVAMWLPIFIFFSQGFEHAVVNFFMIPTGMMLGAEVNIAQWWGWNQLPVLLGNLVGAALMTSALLYFSTVGLKRWDKTLSMASDQSPVSEALKQPQAH